MNRNEFEIEVCAASIQSVIAAEKGGANRVELCDNLYEGGTTPSIGTLLQSKENADIDVFVMIRPRGGDFLYSDKEIEIMEKDIELAKKHGADGFVFGCLNADGTVNTNQCARLIEKAGDLPVTFHRAFDMCIDPLNAFYKIKELGFRRLLTSGQQNKAFDGISLIHELVKISGNDNTIMVGSGVDENNIIEIAKNTNAKAFHVTLREEIYSNMRYQRDGIFMGGLPEIPEFSNNITSADRLKKLIDKLQQVSVYD